MYETEKAVNDFNIKQLRRKIKEKYPHVKVSIRTVSFSDLARAEAKFATLTGAAPADWKQIKDWASQAGVIVH